MRVLIIDDDGDKRKALAEFVRELYPDAVNIEKASYQSGCEEALISAPDIILLDMTLPTYDVIPAEGETGGRHRPYGGRDVLRELSRRDMPSRVVIVTQYDMFSDGEDVNSLDDLKARLVSEFRSNYVATIFFQSSSSSWRSELAEAMAEAILKNMEG
ncbi:MAG TPA: hypothetical protein VG269_20080 [Tepidisphaeraceae bacterium]|jgi:DNA-binding NarL/FixJ family response regulator|nr:hypothetical protein [Tepidisphaeraceae bacterium]